MKMGDAGDERSSFSVGKRTDAINAVSGIVLHEHKKIIDESKHKKVITGEVHISNKTHDSI